MEIPQHDELARLYQEGHSLREIAGRYGISHQTVKRRLVAIGVPRRAEGRPKGVKDSRPRSPETITKLRENIALARTRITDEGRERQRQKMLGRKPWNTGKTSLKLSAAKTGAKNPMWRGGPRPDDNRLRHSPGWNARRRECYERDGWLCQDCGIHCGNKGITRIQAHHIVSRRDGGNDELENLVTLCVACHLRRERS